MISADSLSLPIYFLIAGCVQSERRDLGWRRAQQGDDGEEGRWAEGDRDATSQPGQEEGDDVPDREMGEGRRRGDGRRETGTPLPSPEINHQVLMVQAAQRRPHGLRIPGWRPLSRCAPQRRRDLQLPPPFPSRQAANFASSCKPLIFAPCFPWRLQCSTINLQSRLQSRHPTLRIRISNPPLIYSRHPPFHLARSPISHPAAIRGNISAVNEDINTFQEIKMVSKLAIDHAPKMFDGLLRNGAVSWTTVISVCLRCRLDKVRS